MTSQTCCFCCSIKTGVITLGMLSLLGGIADIIFGSIIINNSNCYSYYYDCYNEESSWYGTTSVIQGCVGILVSILMLIGVSSRKPNLLMPYVAMMIVNVVAYIFVGIVLLINAYQYNGAYYGIWLLCWSCILCYFINVVRLYRVLMIQQFLAANGLITTYPSGAVLTPGYIVNSYPPVATVYTTQPGYATRTAYITQAAYTTQQAYPAPGSYPQPGYPQQGYPHHGVPQQLGIYPPQNSYPPPYPGNQPGKV